jgi:hypothetical protein
MAQHILRQIANNGTFQCWSSTAKIAAGPADGGTSTSAKKVSVLATDIN